MLKKIAFSLLVLPFCVLAQDDLLSEIDNQEVNTEVSSAFKSLKIVNLESTKLAAKGDLYLIISHRFGYIKNGFDDFLGLDNANTRIQLLYGITENFTAHVSRDKFRKTYEGAIKYSLLKQKKDGFPVTLVGFNSISINTELEKEVFTKLTFSDRLSYVNQLLISKKFNESLSLEVAPTLLHENFVYTDEQDNTQYAIGLGGRYKLTKRWSLNLDYIAHLNRAEESPFHNPLSIGFDLETGGHIFQMFFSNSRALQESGFIGNTDGSWENRDISFGFNLVRVF